MFWKITTFSLFVCNYKNYKKKLWKYFKIHIWLIEKKYTIISPNIGENNMDFSFLI